MLNKISNIVFGVICCVAAAELFYHGLFNKGMPMENLITEIKIRDIKNVIRKMDNNPKLDVAVSTGFISYFIYRIVTAINKLKGDQNGDIEIIEEECCEKETC